MHSKESLHKLDSLSSTFFKQPPRLSGSGILSNKRGAVHCVVTPHPCQKTFYGALANHTDFLFH